MDHAKVAILLCVRNGEEFIREQMDSYFSQEHSNWELWVSDDGSTDATRAIVGEYAGRGKRITILDGPCRGFAENFLFTAQAVETDADYFAWSDQDDIWLPDKLARAVRCLEEMNRERATLYFGRTTVVDRHNKFMYLSPKFTRPPDFQNALCQNIGAGNTMVFNRKTRALLSFGALPHVYYHDWWAYMLVAGCGGSLWYDPEPCLRYRQHGANLTGTNIGLDPRLQRCRLLFQGAMREWNRANIAALEERRDLLTPENRKVIDEFSRAMKAESLWERFSCFRRSGACRQTLGHNLALYAALGLGKYP